MAERLGTGRSAAAVSEWWTGKSIPDTVAMAALADILGADPGWLAFGDLSDASAPGLAQGQGGERPPRVTPEDLLARRRRVTDAIDADNAAHRKAQE